MTFSQVALVHCFITNPSGSDLQGELVKVLRPVLIKDQESSTRVKAPAKNILAQHINPKANWKGWWPPSAGRTTPRTPIRPAAANQPDGRKSLLTAKCKIGLGTWNVRTRHQTGNLSLLLHLLEKFDWEVKGVAETHWTDTGDFIQEGYQILSSGNCSTHRAGVAFSSYYHVSQLQVQVQVYFCFHLTKQQLTNTKYKFTLLRSTWPRPKSPISPQVQTYYIWLRNTLLLTFITQFIFDCVSRMINKIYTMIG